MATTVQITGARQVENGHEIGYRVNGVGGKGIVFGSKAELLAWIDEHQLTEEDLVALALRIWKARDPSLTFSNISGRTITVDLAIANIVRIT